MAAVRFSDLLSPWRFRTCARTACADPSRWPQPGPRGAPKDETAGLVDDTAEPPTEYPQVIQHWPPIVMHERSCIL